MSDYYCEDCRTPVATEDAVFSTEGKTLGCVAGLALGASLKNAPAALGLAAIGLVVGHIIDEQVVPECPICGVALRLLASHVTSFN